MVYVWRCILLNTSIFLISFTLKALCNDGNISLSARTPVNISSLFYPDNYPDRLVCEWKVFAPDGYKIRVEFFDFNIELGYDFLRLNDTTFTGNDHPRSFLSRDESLNIRFTADEFTNDKGFLLQLSAIDTTGNNTSITVELTFYSSLINTAILTL